MRFGIASGFLWGLDTVILGIALTMGAFIGTPEAIAFAAIASAFMMRHALSGFSSTWVCAGALATRFGP